jgi:hypothetical protein
VGTISGEGATRRSRRPADTPSPPVHGAGIEHSTGKNTQCSETAPGHNGGRKTGVLRAPSPWAQCCTSRSELQRACGSSPYELDPTAVPPAHEALGRAAGGAGERARTRAACAMMPVYAAVPSPCPIDWSSQRDRPLCGCTRWVVGVDWTGGAGDTQPVQVSQLSPCVERSCGDGSLETIGSFIACVAISAAAACGPGLDKCPSPPWRRHPRGNRQAARATASSQRAPREAAGRAGRPWTRTRTRTTYLRFLARARSDGPRGLAPTLRCKSTTR